MKKNKGFTLIELLAVIVILGVLLSISMVAVNKIKKNQDEENRKNQISGIMSSTKIYIANNMNILSYLGKEKDFDGNECPAINPYDLGLSKKDWCVTSSGIIWINVNAMYENGYLEFDVNKYPYMLYDSPTEYNGFRAERYIKVEKCTDEYNKYKIIFEDYMNAGVYEPYSDKPGFKVYTKTNSTTYNDCGCESQVTGTSNKLCIN